MARHGPRPLIAFATGPYGMDEQCAPSRMFNQGIHFSQGFVLRALKPASRHDKYDAQGKEPAVTQPRRAGRPGATRGEIAHRWGGAVRGPR